MARYRSPSEQPPPLGLSQGSDDLQACLNCAAVRKPGCSRPVIAPPGQLPPGTGAGARACRCMGQPRERPAAFGQAG
jgi:hypothetical protein